MCFMLFSSLDLFSHSTFTSAPFSPPSAVPHLGARHRGPAPRGEVATQRHEAIHLRHRLTGRGRRGSEGRPFYRPTGVGRNKMK